MGGVEKSQYHLPPDKVKTKMSLCKLLTQRKAKVGCFKTNSEEENVVDKFSNVNYLSSPKKSRNVLRENLVRGYSDPEYKTTRLSLCCAVTESSSHTPPHSHHFHQVSINNNGNDDDDHHHHIIQTKDKESQTTDSNLDTLTKKTCETTTSFEENKRDVAVEQKSEMLGQTHEICESPSKSESPVKFADDVDYNEDEDISIASSTSLHSCRSDGLPIRHHSKRFSVDNLVVSSPSPTFSARHSSPESVKSVPETKDRRRRLSRETIRENRGNPNMLKCTTNPQQVSMDSLARQSLLAAQVLHLIPADKARERNFLQGRIGANSMLGPVELNRVLPNREVKIFIGTWNMNGEPPPDELNDFMLPDGLEHIPDIIAVGTQESSPERFEWEVKIQETIGPSHVLFHSVTLGTIHLVVFLRRDLLWYCSIAEESSLSVRPGMAFRTKGAAAIAFILFGTSYLFITSHLTAHQDKVKERIHDVKRIVRSLDLPKNLPLRHRIKSKDVTQNFDCVFWFGDLNFRLAQPREDVLHWVEEYKFPFLVDLKSDQLKKLILDGTCLSTFEEGSITFPPTYKYDVGTQNFDTSSKQRTPAYTDRILYKSRGGNLSCVTYSSVPTICTSDHKPVWGVYKGTVRPGIDTIPLSAGLFNRDVYLEGLKRRAADLGRHELGLAAFCCIQ